MWRTKALNGVAIGCDITDPRQPRQPCDNHLQSNELSTDALRLPADAADTPRRPASAPASAYQLLSTQVHVAEADVADAAMLM